MAAIFVLILHALKIFPNAFLAVDLFFLLSGFVLAYSYGDRLDRGEARRRFAIARLIRLYPLYIVSCLIALPAVTGMALFGWDYLSVRVLMLTLVTSPFFIPLPYHGFTIPLNPPAWSLTFELIANALFLVTGTRLCLVIPVIIASAFLLVWGMTLPQEHFVGWFSAWGSFPRTFFSFFVGVLFYRAWRAGKPLPRIAIPAVLIILMVVVMCIVEPHHYRRYHAIGVFLIAPTIIWLGACSSARGLLAKACTYLGAISYALYVLHAPIIMSAEGIRFLVLGATVNTYHQSIETAWVTIPIAFIAAHFLTFRFDKPFSRRLTRRFQRSAAQ